MSDLIDFSPPGQTTFTLAGAKARFYDAGTTNLRTVYANEGLTVAHPSPLLADSSGRFEQAFVATGTPTKCVVTRANDATGYTLDPCGKSAAAGASADQISFAPTAEIPETNVQDAIEAVAALAVRTRKKRLILAHSQSNFNNVETYAWVPADNLYIWNGGIDGDTGTAFEACSATQIRLPWAIASRLAERDRDTDYYLVVVSRGAVSLRATIGTNFLWNTATSGDPTTGKIRFDAGSTLVAYSLTDSDGRLRYTGNLDLDNSTDTSFPARIELISDPAVNVVFNTTADFTSVPPYYTQPITVSTSAGWPPANNAPVRVYPARVWLRQSISVNAELAMTAIGLTGTNRVFDQVWVWPTEEDRFYPEAYRDADFDALETYLATWTDSATQFILTLPWPHHSDTAGATVVDRYWYAIEEVVSAKSSIRKLVPLENTAIADWGDTENVHVVGGRAMQRIGTLIAECAERGGISVPRYESGHWTPTITAVTNVAASSFLGTQRSIYQRIGRFVTASITVRIDPTASGTLTEFRISLPIPTILRSATLPTNAADTVVLGVSSTTRGDEAGTVTADFATETALVSYTCSTLSLSDVSIVLQYEVF